MTKHIENTQDEKVEVNSSNIIFKNINMIDFCFCVRDSDTIFEGEELTYSDIEEKFQEIINNALEGKIVFLNIDFSSRGGRPEVMSTLIDRFKQLKELGVVINMNLVGDLNSCGAYLPLLLAKHKLCTFTYNNECNEILFMVHTVNCKLSIKNMNNKYKLEYNLKNSVDTLNKKLLELIKEFVSLSEEDEKEFYLGEDIYIPFDDLFEEFKKRNLVQTTFPITTEIYK